jgi:hypothetical protein
MSDNYTLSICTAGTIVGASVSAIVYSAIYTAGELTGTITSSGISITGQIIAKGTDYIAGSTTGDVIRGFSSATSAIAGPTISSTSRTAAAGISVIAGAGAALTTSAIVYSAKEAYAYIQRYKEKVAQQVQYPIPFDDSAVLLLEDNSVLLLTNEPEIELKDFTTDKP